MGLAISSDLGWRTSLGLSTGSAFCCFGPLSTGSSASLRHRAQLAFSRHKTTISVRRIPAPGGQANKRRHNLTGGVAAPESAEGDGAGVRYVTARQWD